MGVSTCPVAVADAPADVAWDVLTDTAGYGSWMDARGVEVSPPGRAHPGQVVRVRAREGLPALLHVVAVDAAQRVLQLQSEFPLGIRMENRLSVRDLGGQAQLTFG